MIIVNLKGGLGNQMFQYALGRKLSHKNNDELKLDTGGLDMAERVGDVYRPFSLSKFNIKNVIATPIEIQRLKHPHGMISKILRVFNFKILRKMHIGWEPCVLEQKGDMYLDGFWQSPKYFEDIRDVILNEFSIKENLSPSYNKYIEGIKKSNAISVHVRRGDYETNAKVKKKYGQCTISYYKNAVAEISSKVSNPVFFVFSDDIEWVKHNIYISENVVYVSEGEITDAEEIILMSKCAHNIIANSTFSWWGAWLNQNEEKIVIAPKPWFEKKEKQFKYLIPDQWIRIQKR